jgi:4-hydroxybenzoate polyprenyltransferase
MSRSPSSLPRAALPWRERAARYARLTRLDKPIGIYLLLWPTLDALWLAAGGWPGWERLAIFCLGTLLMRSAGCAVNDVADRNFDGHVARTANRVVAQGLVSVREALGLAAVLAGAAALTLPLLDPACFPLAVVAVLVSVSYPFFKRFFPMPQAYLGIAFSFGIPMAFAAVLGRVPVEGWWLFGANLFWVLAYDTEYAMVDRSDDLRLGLRSSAILFGRSDVAAVALCYGAYLGLLAWLAWFSSLGWAFAAGWLAALASALRHLEWIRGRDPQSCFRAFRHNHWLGLFVFAGIVGGTLWR